MLIPPSKATIWSDYHFWIKKKKKSRTLFPHRKKKSSVAPKTNNKKKKRRAENEESCYKELGPYPNALGVRETNAPGGAEHEAANDTPLILIVAVVRFCRQLSERCRIEGTEFDSLVAGSKSRVKRNGSDSLCCCCCCCCSWFITSVCCCSRLKTAIPDWILNAAI